MRNSQRAKPLIPEKQNETQYVEISILKGSERKLVFKCPLSTFGIIKDGAR